MPESTQEKVFEDTNVRSFKDEIFVKINKYPHDEVYTLWMNCFKCSVLIFILSETSINLQIYTFLFLELDTISSGWL